MVMCSDDNICTFKFPFQALLGTSTGQNRVPNFYMAIPSGAFKAIARGVASRRSDGCTNGSHGADFVNGQRIKLTLPY